MNNLPGPAKAIIASSLDSNSKRAMRTASKNTKSLVEGPNFKSEIALKEWTGYVQMFGDVLGAEHPHNIISLKYPEYEAVWQKTDAAFLAYHVKLIKKLLGKGMSPTAALHVFVQMLLSNFDEFLGFGIWERGSHHNSNREALCIIRILSIIMAEKPDTNIDGCNFRVWRR